MSAEMEALVARATQQLEALETALRDLKGVSGRFRTEDGLVTAEVNHEGALVGLLLSEAVTNHPPAEVAQLILWASCQAAEAAGQERSKVIASLNTSFSEETPPDAPPDSNEQVSIRARAG